MKYKFDVQKRKLVECDGQHLTKAQQEYFKDSKLRDSDGDLVQCFHYTDHKFDAFDKERITDDSYCGRGFYFTSMTTFGAGFGQNVCECYINMTNPLVVEDLSDYQKADLLKYFAENHPDYANDDDLPRIAGYPKDSERYFKDALESFIDDMIHDEAPEDADLKALCQDVYDSWQYTEFLETGDISDLAYCYAFEDLKKEEGFRSVMDDKGMLDILDMKIYDESDLTAHNFHWGYWNEFSSQLTEWAIDNDYDGILSESSEECKIREIVVFEPNQIKDVNNLYPTKSDNFRDNSKEYLQEHLKDMSLSECMKITKHIKEQEKLNTQADKTKSHKQDQNKNGLER